MAVVAKRPVMTSLSATPIFIGSPSASPVMAINPLCAWMTES